MSFAETVSLAERPDAGFTLIELIVGIAILLMLATVVTPVLFGALDKARIDTATSSFRGFSDAIDAFEDDVKEHPGYLHQLTTEISASPSASDNICGNAYKEGTGKGGTATWNGPYLDRTLPGNGRIPVGVGVALDQLQRSGDQNRAGELIVTITEVSGDDARALDVQIDGQDGSTQGAIRWTETAPGAPVTVQYVKPSPRC